MAGICICTPRWSDELSRSVTAEFQKVSAIYPAYVYIKSRLCRLISLTGWDRYDCIIIV